jgi:hypothetical protein
MQVEAIKEPKFKKELILFSEKEYNLALKLSRERLELLMKAIEWASTHKVKVEDAETFGNDMEVYFLERLAKSKPDIQKLGINDPSKIADLLSIDVRELKDLQYMYSSHEGRLKFKDGQVKEDVSPEDYKIFTKDEHQNKELNYAKKIIEVLLEAEEVTTINKRFISQVTGGLVYFNPYNGGELKYNHQKF